MTISSLPRLLCTALLGLAVLTAGLGTLVVTTAAPAEAGDQTHRATSHRLVIPVRSLDRDLPPAPTDLRATEPDRGTGSLAADLDDVAPVPQCGGSGVVPANALQAFSESADVDGDGDADTITGYVHEGQNTLQVTITGGGGSTIDVHAGPGVTLAARPLPGIDLDGDGRDEILVRISTGPWGIQGSAYGLFEVVDCELRAVTLDGEPVVLADFRTLSSIQGFGCADLDDDGVTDGIATWLAGDAGNGTFTGSIAFYAFDDGELDLVGDDGIVLDPDTYGDPTPWPCDGIELG
ncbi:MAG: hypothetical protein AAGE98_15810 [Actinomycetota bacterium]